MSESTDPKRRTSWSRYWATGALTSLPEDFQANYDGEIRAFWHAQCESLADGARILDVCTGNGAVAILLAEAVEALGIDARITAVDLADIQPDRIRQRFPHLETALRRIRFVGGRAFESLALDDASQDLIVSQYGIEYCEPEAAAAQCMRLLRPGGRLALITHAPDSEMIATMHEELRQYEQLDACGLSSAFERWRSRRSSTADFSAELVRAAAALRSQSKQAGSGLHGYALALVEQVQRTPDAQLDAQRDAVVQAFEQLEDGRSRLDQMFTVNRRIHAAEHWTDLFVRAGLVRDGEGPLRYRDRHDVGHWSTFHKP